ncbi:SET domain-containing protein [Leptolyngbya sp. PCC 7375]|nr:SET domain-containing protein [Leptolyngbya sp. PCC 7375]
MTCTNLLAIESIASKGRGVVTTKAIAANTVLEIAPVASFPSTERKIIDTTQIAKYYFVQPEAYQYNNEVDGHFVFGLASLCNHDSTPNSKIEWVTDELGLWSHLTSIQDIASGEEVTLYYTNIDEYTFA